MRGRRAVRVCRGPIRKEAVPRNRRRRRRRPVIHSRPPKAARSREASEWVERTSEAPPDIELDGLVLTRLVVRPEIGITELEEDSGLPVRPAQLEFLLQAAIGAEEFVG